MLFKLCLLLLVLFLIYKYYFRRTSRDKAPKTSRAEGDHRFDISRVEEAQYRDVESPINEREERE